MALNPKLVMSLSVAGDYVLNIFADNKTKLAALPMGTAEKPAFEKARKMQEVFANCHDIDDQTK